MAFTLRKPESILFSPTAAAPDFTKIQTATVSMPVAKPVASGFSLRTPETTSSTPAIAPSGSVSTTPGFFQRFLNLYQQSGQEPMPVGPDFGSTSISTPATAGSEFNSNPLQIMGEAIKFIDKAAGALMPPSLIARAFIPEDKRPKELSLSEQAYGATSGLGTLSTPIGFLTAGIMDPLNWTPIGAGNKIVKEVTAVGDLLQAAGIARKIGISEEIVPVAAKLFVSAKSEKEAGVALNMVQDLQKTLSTKSVGVGILDKAAQADTGIPSLKTSKSEPSAVVAGREVPSGDTMSTVAPPEPVFQPVKSTDQTLSPNRNVFLSENSIKDKSNIPQYLEKSKAQEPVFISMTEELSKGFNNGEYVYRLKGAESIGIKLGRNGERTFGTLNDTLGSTVIINPGEESSVVARLSKDPSIKGVDDFSQPGKTGFLGYKAIHANQELPNGQWGEIQFNTKEGMYQKEWAHKIYDKWRPYIESNKTGTYESILAKVPADKQTQFFRDVQLSNDIYAGRVAVPEKYIKAVDEKIIKTEAGMTKAALPKTELAHPTPRIPEVPRTKDTPLGKSPAVPSKPIVQGSPSYFKSIGDTFAKVKTDVLEYVQNSEERIRQLQKRPGLKIADESNIYQKMALQSGRVAARVEAGYTKAQRIADDIVSLSGRASSEIKAMREQVNNYLHALHTPERNRYLGEGASGMSTGEARAIIATARPEVKRIAEKALELNRETLKNLRDAGVISKELFEKLLTKYKNHVPLQRVMDESQDIAQVLSGRGFDVRSTGIKTAKGSSREVMDILGNIMTNYEQAIIRAEKNIVDNATLKFVRQNKDTLGDLFVVKSPKFVGVTKDGRPVVQRSDDPRVLSFFEDGKPREIYIKDPNLAIAIRGIGREKLGVFMNGVQSITRFYSSMATRFNPEFFLPNKIRDLQETVTFLASQSDMGFKGAAKIVSKDPASLKAVTDWLHGTDSPGAKMYQEMIEAGGTTGGMGLSTRAQVDLNVDKLFDIAASKPRQVAEKLVGYIDNLNRVFEDSTRLSVYRASIEQGVSKDRAAFLAKEASINFNRMGRGGPVINALYMFSNASMQGSTKMMRAMMNPKVAASITTAIGVSVGAVNEWNDSVDQDWRNKVTKWDRNNGLSVMLPSSDGGARYITIPVGWGLKPILVMANGVQDALSGHDFNAGALTKDVLSSFLNAYNPVGGTDITSAIVPTAADMPVDIARNLSWSGAKIRPDWNLNAPRDIQYFDSLSDTAQGRAAIATTKELQKSTGIAISPADVDYAISQLIGGAGRTIKKVANVVLGPASGKPLPLDEYPFVSRFYRQRTAEETGQGTAGQAEELKALKTEQSREDFYRKLEAQKVYDELKTLPPQEANAKFNILQQTNPLLADKVESIVTSENKDLTAIEKSMLGLGVANGDRAEYVYAQLQKLGTPAEKNAKYNEWKDKGIISREVANQIEQLIKNHQNQ